MEIKKTIEESYKFWFGINNVYEEWAKENDLTSNSLMILYLIENSNHEITQKMIGEKLYLPKQTVNSTLNNMKKKELLVRRVNKKNKREKNIILTKNGTEFAKKILNRLYDYEYQAFSLLTEEERELFVAINKKLLLSLLGKESNTN